MKVVLDVPDAERLQLLAEALRLAADVRSRAAGRAARDVLEDPAIVDKRADAARLLRVSAAASWLAELADGLPLFVVDDVAAGEVPIGASAVYPSVPGTASGAPIAGVDAEALAAATRAAAATPPVPTPDEAAQAAAQAALRALTVPANARLHPGDPPVTDPVPPPALLQAAAASPGEPDV